MAEGSCDAVADVIELANKSNTGSGGKREGRLFHLALICFPAYPYLMSRTEQPADGIENLGGEIHRITGKSLPSAQIRDLLALRPLSAQRLIRFFQGAARIQLKKGQSEQLLQAIDKIRGKTVSKSVTTIRSANVDTDLPSLITPQARELAKALKNVFREVYFDQVNRDLRLPEYGGDYEVRPFRCQAVRLIQTR